MLSVSHRALLKTAPPLGPSPRECVPPGARPGTKSRIRDDLDERVVCAFLKWKPGKSGG